MSWIEKAIDTLLINGEGEIHSRIESLGNKLEIEGTKAKGYCYSLKLNAQGVPRANDLIEFVATKIVDYSIPKKMQDEAKEYLIKTGSSSKIIDLQNKAKTLFTDLKKTGEFGEMLLYILVQEILGYPQLISKMTLKTSERMHYHGADGIHVKYETANDSLSLYWGESKMEKNSNTAIKHCFESLKGFLLDTYGYKSTQSRDLQLITNNLNQNINNPALEDILVRYFDLDDNLSNKLNYKGVCFVGFDSKNYPSNPMETTMEELTELFNSDLNKWLKNSGKHIKSHINLEKFEIHIFLIPFPSVQEFRDYFIELVSK
jgi:hypothetical protein